MRIAELLIKSYASFSIQNYAGLSPLAEAVLWENHDIANLLQKYGARPSLKEQIIIKTLGKIGSAIKRKYGDSNL